MHRAGPGQLPRRHFANTAMFALSASDRVYDERGIVLSAEVAFTPGVSYFGN